MFKNKFVVFSIGQKIRQYIMFSLICITGCKKLIEVDSPIQTIVGKEIYSNNASAASVLTGIYATMAEGSFIHGFTGISFGTGLSSDELTLYAGNINQNYDYLYINAANSSLGNTYWTDLYSIIFRANGAIEGINESVGITSLIKNQLIGEAKFIRAFCYFYLVNLYGDVPLLTSIDPQINTTASRTNKDQVYQQIINDLLAAQQLLNDEFVSADAITVTEERVRPNKITATALLSKVYLYTQQWNNAETQSSLVISNNKYNLVPLDKVFLKNSEETIWSIQSRVALFNNLDGIVFNFTAADNGPSNSHPVYLSSYLWNSFEDNDERKNIWADSITSNNIVYPFSNKYKTDINSAGVTEYPIILRLGEQYLIRAEARAEQGKIIGTGSAQEDLNVIRIRAGLFETTAVTQSDILEAIDKERRIELFTEWGNRWLDLKRRRKIDLIMPAVSTAKGSSWEPFKALYPIPVSDITANHNLRGHQNVGYSEQ